MSGILTLDHNFVGIDAEVFLTLATITLGILSTTLDTLQAFQVGERRLRNQSYQSVRK